MITTSPLNDSVSLSYDPGMLVIDQVRDDLAYQATHEFAIKATKVLDFTFRELLRVVRAALTHESGRAHMYTDLHKTPRTKDKPADSTAEIVAFTQDGVLTIGWANLIFQGDKWTRPEARAPAKPWTPYTANPPCMAIKKP